MKKLFWGFVLVLLAIVLLLFYLVDIPYSVRGKGIVKPVKEWGLYKAADGTLMNILEDHLSGSINEYKVMEFQRGDIVGFLFNESLIQDHMIREGDTIAWVVSNELNLRMVEKRGDLSYQQSLLQVYLTGEKPEAVQMALEEVELARQELETQSKLTERIQHLYEQDLVSQQEYELALNDLKVKQYVLEIAQSNYRAIISGEKEEETGVIRSQIASLEYQINELDKHMNAMNILSPITGNVIRQRDMTGTMSDEVIRVADLSSFLVFVPVDAFEKNYIEPGQEVIIRNDVNRSGITGRVAGIDNSVQLINRRPKVFVSVLINNTEDINLLPNMIVDARINTGPVPPMEYLLRMSRVVYQN